MVNIYWSMFNAQWSMEIVISSAKLQKEFEIKEHEAQKLDPQHTA